MPSPAVLLVFGATGSTGRRVLEHALARGLAVHAFVRNAARVPEALRPRLAGVVVGNLNDAAAVAAAVRSVRPDAIVDASSALPIGTPPALIAQINRNINEVLKMRDIQERMAAAGFEVGATSVPEFAAFVKRDFERYGKVIRQANIRAD